MRRRGEDESRGGGSPDGGESRGGASSDGGEMKFRYDRARRLERASDDVRWLASRYGKKADGPLRSIFAYRTTRLMFLMVAVLGAAYFLGTFLTAPRDSGRIGDELFTATAFWYEGRVLVAIRRQGTAAGGRADSEPRLLRAAVSLPGGASATATFPLGEGSSDDFRLSVPGERAKPRTAQLRLALGDRSLDLEIRVE